MLLLWVARAAVLSALNATVDEQLASAVAHVEKPTAAEKAQLAAALTAGADAYTAAGAAQEADARAAARDRAQNATAAAVASSEAISREVLAGQEAAARQALRGLRALPVQGSAHALESSLTEAEQAAQTKLDALDEAKALSEKKHALVVEASKKLADVKASQERTVKEAETAAEIASEKQADAKAIAAEEEKAESTLKQAAEEEEAVSAMVDRKASLNEAAAQKLKATTEEAVVLSKEAAKPEQRPVPKLSVPASLPTSVHSAAVVAARLAAPAENVESLKAENERLRQEKAQLAQQLASAKGAPQGAAKVPEAKALLHKRLDKLK